jgi:virulence factor Mce-like protein
MQRYIKPLGILVAALLVVGAAGLVLRNPKDTYTVTAYFEKAIGLFPNSDVNILGVPVGKVTAVDPEGSKVKVVMEVNEEYKVPADAFAQIVPISVIADRFVQLHPAYTDGPVMEPGAMLDTDRTQIPAELDDVFKQLKKLLEAIEPGDGGEPGALGNLIVALNDAVGDRADDLKGTVVNTAALTGALSDAQGDLSDLLINLDNLFGKLSQRAGSIGSLNKNMAIVLSTLAESRGDLEATLANLASMTGEVGRVLEQNRATLGEDLDLAGNVLAKVLENKGSVEESLQWLPVVGIGLANAYHGGQYHDIDVRDNQNRINCGLLDDLPAGPIKDTLQEACREQTGEPDPRPRSRDAASAPDFDKVIDCEEGTRQAKRQLRRLRDVNIDPAVMEEIVDPLKKKLRKLARECEELKDEITGDGGILDDIRADGVGTIPDLDETIDGLDDGLIGNAAGGAVTGTSPPSFAARVGDWFGGFLGFLGWGS